MQLRELCAGNHFCDKTVTIALSSVATLASFRQAIVQLDIINEFAAEKCGLVEGERQ